MSSLLGGAYSDSEHSDYDESRPHRNRTHSYSTLGKGQDEIIMASVEEESLGKYEKEEILIDLGHEENFIHVSESELQPHDVVVANIEQDAVENASVERMSPSAGSDEIIIHKLEESSINESSIQIEDVKYFEADMEIDEAIEDIVDPQYYDLMPPFDFHSQNDDSDLDLDPSDSYDAVQERIAKFIRTMVKGNCDFTESIKNKQEFGNPAVLTKICEHYGVNDKQSNYPIEIFNPNGYDMSDYYDNLASESRKRHREKQASSMPPPSKISSTNSNIVTTTNRSSQWGSASVEITDTSASVAKAKAAAADIAAKISTSKRTK